jgi:TolA-binding protein
MSRAVVRTWLVALLMLAAWLSGGIRTAEAMAEAERLWLVAERAFQDGLYPLSRRMLERLIERYPNDPRLPEATLLLGKARFSQGQYEQALEAFRLAQGFSPVPGRPGEALFWEAEALFRLKKPGEARALYERVLADAPASPLAPDALYGLAWASLELKRREAAATEFRRLLDRYPDHRYAGSAAFYLARTLVELKRVDEAVPLLRAFPSKYPDHRLLPEARALLGEALLAAGESQDGVAQLRAFIAVHPDHALAGRARRLIVDTLLKQGKKAELLEEYRALVAQSPPTAEGLYDAGAIAQRLGRPKDAETLWARLRKEFPDHALAARASLDLAQSAFGRKSYKEAATLARAAARSPEDPIRGEAFVLLGESELKQGRFKSAHQAFQSAAETSGLDAALRYRALAGSGLALEEQRQWAQAAKYYDEVVAGSPDKELRAWARQRRAAVGEKLKPATKPRAAAPAPKSKRAGAAKP